MSLIAVFPGSFDPFTIGHQDIVNRALPMFDKMVIAIGINGDKHAWLSIEERKHLIEKCFQGNKKVEVTAYEGLTVDFCQKIGAKFIVRGIRNTKDFEFEKEIADINKKLNSDIETLFLATTPELAAVSSTAVREIHRCGGDYKQFLP
ncbi:MAG: pantetheine-phosphate adenylyltransferase [Bacteroidales bacterium]|nr:pantetheine-phosphate adenylyltransferase [Bacteroidales bacterium]